MRISLRSTLFALLIVPLLQPSVRAAGPLIVNPIESPFGASVTTTWEKTAHQPYGWITPALAGQLIGHPVTNTAQLRPLLHREEDIDALVKSGVIRFAASLDIARAINEVSQSEWLTNLKSPKETKCWFTNPGATIRGAPPSIGIPGYVSPFDQSGLKGYVDQACQAKIDTYRQAAGPGQACFGLIQCDEEKPPKVCACDIVRPVDFKLNAQKEASPTVGSCPGPDECLRQCTSGKFKGGLKLSSDAKSAAPGDDPLDWKIAKALKHEPKDYHYVGSPVRLGNSSAALCLGKVQGPDGTKSVASCLTTGPHCPSAVACLNTACSADLPASVLAGAP